MEEGKCEEISGREKAQLGGSNVEVFDQVGSYDSVDGPQQLAGKIAAGKWEESKKNKAWGIIMGHISPATRSLGLLQGLAIFFRIPVQKLINFGR